MADDIGNIFVRLGLDEKDFYNGLDRAQDGLQRLTEEINRSGERIDTMTKLSGGKLSRMGQQVSDVGKDIEKADCILVFSCGVGVQTVAERFEDKPVYAACDTLRLPGFQGVTPLTVDCGQCGECFLN